MNDRTPYHIIWQPRTLATYKSNNNVIAVPSKVPVYTWTFMHVTRYFNLHECLPRIIILVVAAMDPLELVPTCMDAYLEVITFWDTAKLILLLLGINNDNLYGVDYGKARIHCSLQDLYCTVISL